MRPIRDRVIEDVNKYILKELEDKKLEWIVEGIDVEELRLKNIELAKVETDKHSYGYKEYLVYRHVFHYEGEEICMDVEQYNSFEEAVPSGGYTVYYDTKMGTEVHHDGVDERTEKIYEVLSEIDYSSVFSNEIVNNQLFKEEYKQFFVEELKVNFLHDIPGVKDILPSGYDTEIVDLVFDNGLKCTVNGTELRRNLESLKLNQE